MNTLPKILFAIGAENELGAGLLVLNDRDPLLGRIIQYRDQSEMTQELNQKEPIAYAVVPGYSIVIKYAGILGKGYRFPPEQRDHINQTMWEFALWYLQHKIEASPSRFKRYKIMDNDTKNY